eukprot:g6518.t1
MSSASFTKGENASSPSSIGKIAKGLAHVILCDALAQGVAYPLGLDAAAALAMGIQVVAWIPSALAQKETFYDFTGMLTFIAVTLFSAVGFVRSFFEEEVSEVWRGGSLSEALLTISSRAPRHLVAMAFVLIWTTRLGTFLLARIRRDGHDSRFNGVRDHPLDFLVFWCVQGMWVFFTPLPMLVLLKVDPKDGMGDLRGAQDMIGLASCVAGFALEVVADRQKRAFKEDPANSDKFIDVGLWSRCRHPNYVGEMTIWTGFFVMCSRGVVGGAGWLTLIGPMFVTFLLYFVSTPTLEEGADKKYGGQAAYQEYKRNTPALRFRLV